MKRDRDRITDVNDVNNYFVSARSLSLSLEIKNLNDTICIQTV